MKHLVKLCRQRGEIKNKNPDIDIIMATMILYESISEGKNINFAPEDIEFTINRSINISNTAEIDLYWSAPEIIFNHSESNRETNLFSLGLYIFAICTGESVYEKNGQMFLSDLKKKMKNNNNLIMPVAGVHDAISFLLMNAASKFTSFDPQKRKEGEKNLKKAVAKAKSQGLINWTK